MVHSLNGDAEEGKFPCCVALWYETNFGNSPANILTHSYIT